MKAYLFDDYGGPQHLKLIEIDDPRPRENEALIEVHACALNHRDLVMMSGQHPLNQRADFLPHIGGSDIAGVVIDAPSDRSLIGKAVVVYPGAGCGTCSSCLQGEDNLCKSFQTLTGGLAEYIVVPIRSLRSMPAHLNFLEAACLPVAYLTAWQMLQKLKITENTTLLVCSGSSGVGVASIQFAKRLGAKIVTTTGNPKNFEKLSELGALNAFAREDELLVDKLIAVAPSGFDAVLNPVGGGKTWEISFQVLRPGGSIVVCGQNAGNEVSITLRTFFSNSFSLYGVRLGTHYDFDQMLDFVEINKIHPVINQIFQFEETKQAHEYLARGGHLGKVVISIKE